MELAPTLGWHTYVDSLQFDAERRACFAQTWHYVGTTSNLEEVGARRAEQALEVPVLLVRDDAGDVRAFVNACRHRGARLEKGSGCAKAITCPYHGWTYALDGRLRAAPRLQAEADVTPVELAASRSLHELRIETWGPMLFVALDEQAPPLHEWLGPITGRVAALGIDVEALAVRHTWDGESACNWKVTCENYLECYHCRIAHRGFCDVVDVSSDAYELSTAGRVATQVAPRHDRVERDGFDGQGHIERGEFHFVFPNFVAYVPPGSPVLVVGPVVPRAVDRTWRRLDYLADASVPNEVVTQFVEWDDQVGAEDAVLVEAVQAGMASAPLLERGVLMPESEQLVAWFAGQVRRATS